MLLQVILKKEASTVLYPMAINPKDVVSVVFVEPDTVLRQPESDEHVSAITFNKQILVGLNKQGEKVYIEDAFVAGHFQEISIALQLDTDGRIADEVEMKNN